MEPLDVSFDTLSEGTHALSFIEVSDLGLKMLDITMRLHELGLSHGAAGARDWMLRNSQGYVNDVVLVGMNALRSITDDPTGVHRITELQQLAMTLRYIYAVQMEHHYAVNTTTTWNINDVCYNDSECPTPLSDLLEYVMSVDRERGSFDGDMYSTIRQKLGAMKDLAEQVSPGIYDNSRKVFGRMVPDPVYVLRSERIEFQDKSQLWAIDEAIALGTSGIVYGAAEIVQEGNPQSFRAVKCRRYNIFRELKFLHAITEEAWAPKHPSRFNHAVLGGCIVMEKYGESLEALSRRGEIAFTAASVSKLGLQMLDIIQTLNTKYQILHRDISPANWLVRAGTNLNDLVLIDFGDAWYVWQDRSGEERMKDVRGLVSTLNGLVPTSRKGVIQKLFEAVNGELSEGIYDTLRALLVEVGNTPILVDTSL